jgi:hypothetical protein
MLPGRGCCIRNLADLSAALAAIGRLPQGPSPLPVEMAYTGTPNLNDAWPYPSGLLKRAPASHEVAVSCEMAPASLFPNASADGWQYIALRYIVNAHFSGFHNLGNSLLLNGVGDGHCLRDRQIDFHCRARPGVVNAELSAQSANALAHSTDAHARFFEV